MHVRHEVGERVGIVVWQGSVCAEGVGAQEREVDGVLGYEGAGEDPFAFEGRRADGEGEGGAGLGLGLGRKVACGWWLEMWR